MNLYSKLFISMLMAAVLPVAINANTASANQIDGEEQSVKEIHSLITGEWKTDTIQTFLGEVAYNYTFYSNGTGKSTTYHIVMGEPETDTADFRWELTGPTAIKITADNATGLIKSLSVIDKTTIKLGGDTFRLVRKTSAPTHTNGGSKTGTTVKNQTIKKPSVKGKSKRKR